jgi:predicted membrane protein
VDLRSLLFGLALIIVGGLLVLQRADVIGDFNLWQLWPLILIGLGIVMLAERQGSPLGGAILLSAGVIFLVGNILPGSAWSWVWPLALVGVGIWIITQRDNVISRASERRDRDVRDGGQVIADNALNLVTVFRDHTVNNEAAAFRGGSVVTVLGELHLDLRDASLDGQSATMDITNVLGETEVLVPPGWSVRVNRTAILGEVNDRTTRVVQPTADTPTLTIRVTAILGEVTVRQ